METSAAIQISAENLSKQFHTNGSNSGSTVSAYQGLNFDIPRGEFFCLLGPSGCGKSTVLRTIAALEQASGGRLTVHPDHHDAAADIGMVFQERGIFPWMTVTQNIRFLLENNPRITATDIDRIVDEYVSKVGLSKFKHYYPHQISGGMKQRVSIARSFANDPDILLMDEPFVFLDYQTRMSLQDLLLEIWNESRKTVVFVTHDIEEAVILADRILVMTAHPGRMKKLIPIDLPRPRHVHEVRKNPLFHDYINDISALIREENENLAAELGA
jgi:NitT/TauT family transport system ATP-binding protein